MNVPYIHETVRHVFDSSIHTLQDFIHLVPRDKRKGALNYVLSRLALGVWNTTASPCGRYLIPNNYHDISDAISALRDAADEIARRVMGPREDAAIEKNGDLIEYWHSRHDDPDWPSNEELAS